MKIFKTISETRRWSRAVRASDETVGFVPTMGALHEGHLSLVRAAKQSCDRVVASIFINPTQFGPNEDFARYPRTFAADCGLLTPEGVDALFHPDVAGMYPEGASAASIASSTIVDVAGIGSRLDGRSRPGHFRGVATVVSKLFNIVEPDRAYFGQKDAAQVAVIRRMVRDLHVPVEIVVCPIAREPDGLAMSSRNRFLNAEERQQALVLWRALEAVRQMFDAGLRDAERLRVVAQDVFSREPKVLVDYIEAVDPESLVPVQNAGGALFAVAAKVGATRLIDNIVLPL